MLWAFIILLIEAGGGFMLYSLLNDFEEIPVVTLDIVLAAMVLAPVIAIIASVSGHNKAWAKRRAKAYTERGMFGTEKDYWTVRDMLGSMAQENDSEASYLLDKIKALKQ
jgi:cbb3-type cytochrome oxidase subunit 1